MHARETIRKAFVAAVTGLDLTGTNVFVNSSRALQGDLLPALSLYFARDPETRSGDGEQGGFQERDLPVSVELRLKELVGMADLVDDICFDVEYALMNDAALKALINNILIESTEMDVDEEGERPVTVVKQEWLVTYRVDGRNPSVPVP